MSFCSHCGGNLAFDRAPFCAHCGKPQGSPGPMAVAAPARALLPVETTLFDSDSVTVTTARFIVPGQTYAISGITSIANTTESSAAPIVLILVGVGIAAIGLNLGDIQGGTGVAIIGALIFIFGVIAAIITKTKNHIVLTTSAGEVRAFTSQNKTLIDDVLVALNQAIVRRN